MRINFRQLRNMPSRELHDLHLSVIKEIEARNTQLRDGRWVLDVSDEDINTLHAKERKGTHQWYVLNWEKYGRIEQEERQ